MFNTNKWDNFYSWNQKCCTNNKEKEGNGENVDCNRKGRSAKLCSENFSKEVLISKRESFSGRSFKYTCVSIITISSFVHCNHCKSTIYRKNFLSLEKNIFVNKMKFLRKLRVFVWMWYSQMKIRIFFKIGILKIIPR